ncbi:hypothetical protein NS226_15015 [Aureimonas ureilytica]|uniref:VWFA domain-containing protein n=1 Tax=Aureimonas ureilytica TaxID=401562 RepID=A0A175R606_9HYPH|nr:VWA domain-containing protein [Aureimonas ureilytica]KTQ92614.1 hypothetical protein NS226_15015 [Aureimonas ureilytica]
METHLFHFLRPDWFWALIPAGLLLWLALISRKSATGGQWAQYVDAHLLRHLAISGESARASRVLPSVAAAMLVVLVTALAGPTWQKAEVPSFTGGEPVVAVLSLAQSMNSTDLSPSRLRSAVHKLSDILTRTEGDERALVIYSDVPFVAAPLTSDQKVISQMMPELSTKLMPVLGDRPDLAISEAVSVLKGADAARGKIVLIADNAGDAAATEKAASEARKAGYTVSVLGVGTEKGATLQTAGGQAITDRSGKTVTTSLDAENLSAVARDGGGVYSSVTANSADLDRILPKTDSVETAGKAEDVKADSWVDMGYWLLILPVLLLPLAFRRGLVFSLGLIAGLNFVPGLATRPAHAETWQDLWATSDQQGKQAFASGDYKAATGKFETPSWRASAAYRAGDYAAAAQEFSANAYNRGNALAKSGQLKEALGAYDEALAANPQDADAKFNRELVQKLLDEQKKKEEQEKNQQQQAGGKGQKQDQPSQGQSGQQDQKDQQSGSQGQQKPQNAGGQQQQQAGGNGQKQDQQPSQGQSGQQGQHDQKAGSKQKQNGGQSGDQQQSAAQPGQESSSQNGTDQQSASQGEQPKDQAAAQASKPADQAKDGQSPKAGAKKDAAEKAGDQKAGAGQEQKQEASATKPQGQEGDRQQAGQQQDQPQDKTGSDGLAEADQAVEKAAKARQQAGASGSDGEQTGKKSENALSRMLSSVLDGNGGDKGGEPVKASVPGAPVVDQAVEQQLREVPDDPSGLLRARIRQHYAQLRSGSN